MKHAAKLAEWGEKIQICRSSGMTVKEWCKKNHVCCKTYYTWERVYLAEVSKQLAISNQLSGQTGQLVRIEPDQLRDEARNSMTALPVQTTSNVGIILRYGNMFQTKPEILDFSRFPAIFVTNVILVQAHVSIHQ